MGKVAASLETMAAEAYAGDLRHADGLIVDLGRALPSRTLRVVDGGQGATSVSDVPRGLLAATPLELGIKRAMDLLLGIIGILLLLPLLLATAMAVAVSSQGPILYVQERIGRDGRSFRMYKFRSMYRNSHQIKAQYMAMNEVNGPVFKCRRDPRITPVGRLIRKLSLDEFPQLINVLRGEMSLVGPRPPLPEEYRSYGPRELSRMSVLPGMTGIWQVSGRSDLDFDTWVALDIRYIDTWSLWQDVKLLAQTVPAVITARGAY